MASFVKLIGGAARGNNGAPHRPYRQNKTTPWMHLLFMLSTQALSAQAQNRHAGVSWSWLVFEK
ncbi:hypothetical protein JAB1_19220 [Janthinobacterium sp. MP5059B]|uniref:hypothetical protein n=1 Tax=Janthinobacterium TaxID=29580 RepID=UPI00089382E0|nr:MULTISPECIES: hypothetical protein [Janthinobacterium]MBR7634519.1 hypothetical protein [Janthinobacterium lividum]OEZ50804.1 hypothetical protein JAB1_19220 [Janthinobacterium sp. MP5059B]